MGGFVGKPIGGSIMIQHKEETVLWCVECSEPIRGTPYFFGGALACEKCVRRYYRNSDPETVALELRERAVAAEPVIKEYEQRKAKKLGPLIMGRFPGSPRCKPTKARVL